MENLNVYILMDLMNTMKQKSEKPIPRQGKIIQLFNFPKI